VAFFIFLFDGVCFYPNSNSSYTHKPTYIICSTRVPSWRRNFSVTEPTCAITIASIGNPVEAIDVVSDFSLVGKGKEKRIRCNDDDSSGERDSCSKSSRTPTSNIGNNKRVRRSFMSELSFLDDFDITEVIGDGPLLSPALGPTAPATPEKNNDIVSIRHTHANLVEQLPSPAIEAEGDNVAMRTPTRKPRKKKISLNVGAKAAVSINSTSQYRGVSRHK
jgi:hypothetical protein